MTTEKKRSGNVEESLESRQTNSLETECGINDSDVSTDSTVVRLSPQLLSLSKFELSVTWYGRVL